MALYAINCWKMSLWNYLFPKESHLGYINCKYMRITTCQMNGGKRRGKIVLHVVHINYKQVFTGVSSISKMSWNKISKNIFQFPPRVTERGTKRNQPWVPTMGILLLSIFCSQGHFFFWLIRTKLIDFTRTNIIQILTFNIGVRMPFD